MLRLHGLKICTIEQPAELLGPRLPLPETGEDVFRYCPQSAFAHSEIVSSEAGIEHPCGQSRAQSPWRVIPHGIGNCTVVILGRELLDEVSFNFHQPINGAPNERYGIEDLLAFGEVRLDAPLEGFTLPDVDEHTVIPEKIDCRKAAILEKELRQVDRVTLFGY